MANSLITNSSTLVYRLTFCLGNGALLCSGYNSTEAFNDHRLVDIARLVPCGPVSDQNISQDDSSLPILNTAVCHLQTPVTSNDNSIADDVALVDDQSVLTDLKVGISLPASLADGLPLAKTVAEAEPVLPELEIPTEQSQCNPSRVTPEARQALETLLGVCEFRFCFQFCFYDITVLVFGADEWCEIFCKNILGVI